MSLWNFCAAAPILTPSTRDPIAFVNAGNRLVVDLAPEANMPAVAVVPQAELAEKLAWRSPRLEFTDTPLAEAVDLMNRESSAPGQPRPARIIIDPTSPGLDHEPVSGLFRSDNTEAFVRMLEVTLGLHAEYREGQIVLHRLQ